MAWDDINARHSAVAGATFSTADLYKGVIFNSSGHVILPNTTSDVGQVAGVLYEDTASTDAAGSQAVSYVSEGVTKLRMAASTLSQGDTVAISTGGLGTALAAGFPQFGVIVDGSSGGADRVVSVQIIRGSS